MQNSLLATPPDRTRTPHMSLFEEQKPYSPPREFGRAPPPPYTHPKSHPPASTMHPVTACDEIDLFTYDSQKKTLPSSAPVWWDQEDHTTNRDPLPACDSDPFFCFDQRPTDYTDTAWLR
eukprot:TRINITY_DN28823_c0_g1_i1.p1 TRINITY_DN28823_c0_g1~~TRINITY_DN28823_c0_g1_i1.p1  ORF type:complete len:130 (+),score=18.79 TRINITY_DN28823_c0_g1_i1:32-391(+)